MERKGTYTILLSIIAVLSLALAVLVVFLFISYPSREKDNRLIQTDNPITERVVPDEEMGEFKLFDGQEKLFALKDEPDRADSIVLGSV